MSASCTKICSGPKMKGVSLHEGVCKMGEVLNENPDYANSAEEGSHFREVFEGPQLTILSTLEGSGMQPSGVQMCPTTVISHVHNRDFLLEKVPSQYFILWMMQFWFWKCSQMKWWIPLFSRIVSKVLSGA